jgi:hypothetical protein
VQIAHNIYKKFKIISVVVHQFEYDISPKTKYNLCLYINDVGIYCNQHNQSSSISRYCILQVSEISDIVLFHRIARCFIL